MKFKENKTVLTTLLGLFFLQGCSAKNSSFSPSIDGENIHFTATVPSELEALPISAIYRSEVCRKERRNSNRETYTIPGFHRATYPLSIGQSNQMGAYIPESGGGQCDWKLSNIKFEVRLKDPSKIDPLISKNFGMEATFVLDNNTPATFDGGYEKKSGNFNETLVLFPLLVKDFMNGNIFKYYIIGKSDPLTYKITNTKHVNINISYKKQYLSVWTGRINNHRPFMTYPNGNIVYGEVRPEYKKLLEISESMTQK